MGYEKWLISIDFAPNADKLVLIWTVCAVFRLYTQYCQIASRLNYNTLNWKWTRSTCYLNVYIVVHCSTLLSFPNQAELCAIHRETWDKVRNLGQPGRTLCHWCNQIKELHSMLVLRRKTCLIHVFIKKKKKWKSTFSLADRIETWTDSPTHWPR